MWRRLTAPILLPLVPLVTACSTVVPVHSPAEYIPLKAPSTVWVTKTDNSTLRLLSPQVITDTLSGFVEGEYVEMPLSSVQSMRARQATPGRTALLVGGITVAGAIGVYLTIGRASGVACVEPPGGSGSDEAVC